MKSPHHGSPLPHHSKIGFAFRFRGNEGRTHTYIYKRIYAHPHRRTHNYAHQYTIHNSSALFCFFLFSTRLIKAFKVRRINADVKSLIRKRTTYGIFCPIVCIAEKEKGREGEREKTIEKKQHKHTERHPRTGTATRPRAFFFLPFTWNSSLFVSLPSPLSVLLRYSPYVLLSATGFTYCLISVPACGLLHSLLFLSLCFFFDLASPLFLFAISLFLSVATVCVIAARCRSPPKTQPSLSPQIIIKENTLREKKKTLSHANRSSSR
jgi:hypothetical protein